MNVDIEGKMDVKGLGARIFQIGLASLIYGAALAETGYNDFCDCYLPQGSRNLFTELQSSSAREPHTRFLELALDRAEGDSKSCLAAEGQWSFIGGQDSKNFMVVAPEDYLSPYVLGHKQSQQFHQVYLVYQKGKVESETWVVGILAETAPDPHSAESSWYLAQVEGEPEVSQEMIRRLKKDHTYSSFVFSRLPQLSAAITDHLAGQSTPGIRVDLTAFNSEMTEMKFADGTVFSNDTLDFSKQLFRWLQQEKSFSGLLEPQRFRIPVAMYDLVSNPEYLESLEARKYSKAIDMIWRHALELAGGDIQMGLFFALQFSDLRQRGPCGAIFGRRGGFVPRSIFDGELPSILEPSRYDAINHFFAYALIATYPAGRTMGWFSTWQYSFRKRHLPATANWFRESHDIGFGETSAARGYDDPTPGIAVTLRGSQFEETRPKIDVDRDTFYNSLGMQFGAALVGDPEAKPSATLNALESEKRKNTLGLGNALQSEWKAYDPYHEVLQIAARSSSEHDRSLPRLRAALEKAEGLADKIKLTRRYCETYPYEGTRIIACRMFSSLYLKILRELYQKYHYSHSDRVKAGWIVD